MKSIILKRLKRSFSFIPRKLKLINGFTFISSQNTVITIPRPRKNKILLESTQVGELGGYEQAIKFVVKYSRGKYPNALNIIKANRDINSESKWLKHMNAYFNSFNMSPIELKVTSGTRYQKLYSHTRDINNRNILVSIIITAYNSQETIKQSIESVQNQSWKNIEILIIDDNSSDDTWDIISDIASTDDRIRAYKNNVNVGSYVSKNIALKKINGKYFTCHDSDDWSHPERISKQVTQMEEDNANASIILMLRAKHSMEITRFHRINQSCIDGIARFSLISCMFNTEYFKEYLGSWDTVRVSADSELYERANILLGNDFKKYKILGLICLDGENSLTNHPKLGLKTTDKKNSPRKKYSISYREWHKTIKKSQHSAYLEFPQTKRMFEAPDISLTPNSDIVKLLRHYKINSSTTL